MISYKKVRKIFPLVYLILLVIGFFYIRELVSTENLSVTTRDEESKKEEVKSIDVSLIVETQSGQYFYEKEVRSTNTFDDLLERLRKEDGFTYEQTAYIHGMEFEHLNGNETPTGYSWRIYENGEEITFEASGKRLLKDAQYLIIPEPVQ